MTISISCPHCRRPYRMKDKFAGSRVKCSDCGGEIAVPNTAKPGARRSAGGSEILQHQSRQRPEELVFEATPFLADIERHIQRTIGPTDIVWHELVSEDIHVDLHIVPPRNIEPCDAYPLGGNHWTVVTSGVSTRPMTIPAKASTSLRYAELMIVLPADWPGMADSQVFETNAMQDENNWWPIRWLKNLARLPHEFDTYLASGHTIPNGDPAEPFSDTTELSCMLVLPSLTAPESNELQVNDDILINFYALWPIYREEMEFKLQQGLNPLLEKFDEIELFELIQLDRPNVCR